MSELPKAVWSGEFDVLGVKLRCHVLDNGERVIEAESMEKFFREMGDMPAAATLDFDSAHDFVAFMRGRPPP